MSNSDESLDLSSDSESAAECYRNYTAPEVFVQGLAGIVDQEDAEQLLRYQKEILQRFEKANETLKNATAISTSHLKEARQEAMSHCATLTTIKKDLQCAFNKICALRKHIEGMYPGITTVQNEEVKEFTKQCEESPLSDDVTNKLCIEDDSESPAQITTSEISAQNDSDKNGNYE